MNTNDLKQAIRGTVTTRADAGYETVRQGLLWNGRKPDRFPEIVVRAKDAADVRTAVKFAAATGRRVSPRGGGHQFSGIALQDCVVIDLSQMNALSIDADARIARAQPTVTNGKLAAALAEHGLAFPTGHCASVPLSGYLLGGGFGWNAGAWGIACHNVDSVEVVLADGSLVNASETENPEIFWAVRGAGPEFFGVVTEYRLRLHDLPRAIRTSMWTYEIDEIGAVERWMSRAMTRVPRNVEFTAAMSSAPPPLAGHATKTVAGVATIFAASEEEADETLSIIAEDAPEGALDVQLGMETPFEVLYLITGQFYPEGRRYAVDTNWSADPSALLTRMAEAVKDAPSPESYAIGVVLPPMDGETMPDTAFSMAGPAFGSAYAIWQDDGDDAANFAWLRGMSADIAPISMGHYIGEADLDLAERSPNSFAAPAYERLLHLQRKYDPTGLFYRPGQVAEPMRRVS
ncbi:FAD-binding oxidoreductase [Oricola nitratireducens]|uniref:FAD-binding oxidoreductase n=1 Tax=Oricola nitratireducens TaxID=2775868 RepID=UPI001868D212|nr:FAD-binding oxidoreductase [Oricola nitratireducens]